MEAYVSVFKEEVRCWQTGASVHYEMLSIQKKNQTKSFIAGYVSYFM